MAHQRAFPCSIEFFAPFRQRMIRRFAAVAIAAAVAAACPSALGQVDAADAYKQAKDAFAKNDFSSARDLLIKASQTDPKNPEVFLLLGKSEYQLGHVEQAINAWNTTVTLSPNEPYSAQMLKALRGDITDIDASLALCTSLLKQSRAEPALVIIDRLLKEKSLSETQRPKAMLIKAECLLKTNKDAQAEALVEEMLLKYPKSPDVARANWILGSVRLERTDQVAQGLALLKKVATENPDTDFGAAAQLSLITFALTDSQTLANSAELSKWIAAHPNHTDSEKARQALLTFALNISRMQGLPDPSATLNDADKAAIAAVIDIYKHAPTATETAAATKTLMNHLSSHYSSNRSYGAAIEGAQSLLKGNPAGKSRMLILQSLAAYQIELALRDLAISAEAGDVPAAMPKPISDALATLNMATKEFPFEALWPKQARRMA